MTNNYQSRVLDSSAAARLALPETVRLAVEEIAADMREGLLALAVGAGLQVMAQLMEADVAAVCGPQGKHNSARDAVRHGVLGAAGSGWPAPGSGPGVDHFSGDRTGFEAGPRGWWADTTLGTDFGVAGASTDEVYAAMDWLVSRQDAIEATLAARHLADTSTNPHKMALFDLSSSWVEGRCCPLAARGYSRDGKKGKAQIEYGLLTDPDGRPVAIRVFAGNTADPAAFVAAVEVVRERFGLSELVMVGDRGMITSARIEALREVGGTGWLTALRAPAIAKLARAGGPLQPMLFDQTDLAEITHPPTTPTSAWSPAATHCWPLNGPANARTCWPSPTSCWTPSSPRCARDACPAPTTSASRSAK